MERYKNINIIDGSLTGWCRNDPRIATLPCVFDSAVANSPRLCIKPSVKSGEITKVPLRRPKWPRAAPICFQKGSKRPKWISKGGLWELQAVPKGPQVDLWSSKVGPNWSLGAPRNGPRCPFVVLGGRNYEESYNLVRKSSGEKIAGVAPPSFGCVRSKTGCNVKVVQRK